MFQHSLVFDRPGYLALLALIPVLAWLGHRSLASLGSWRRWTTLTLRSLVALGIILALADAQYRRESDELTVVYLLDQSLSIPATDRQAMLKYVETSLEGERSTVHDDRFAVIAFGRDAAVEVPPMTTDHGVPGRLESRRLRVADAPETMSRLQSRKAQIAEQLNEQRSATRFEWDESMPNTGAAAPVVEQPATANPKTPEAPSLKPENDVPAVSYTERLLKAKKQVWNDPPAEESK